MSSNAPTGPSAATPTRRRLMRSLAWATPTVIVSTASPAFAASSVVCPTTPPATAWTTTTTGDLGPTGSGGFGWNTSSPYQFNEYRDNGSTAQNLVITTSTTVNLVAGTTHTLDVPFSWGYGNRIADQSTPQTVTLTIGNTQVFSIATRSPSLGVAGSTTQVAGTYTATTTGPVTMQLTFTVSPKTKDANDDVVITAPVFTRCVR